MPASVSEGGVRLSTAPADMRKSFGGLAGIATLPRSGDVTDDTEGARSLRQTLDDLLADRSELGPGFVGRAPEALPAALLLPLCEFEFRLLEPLRTLRSELVPELRPLGRDLDPVLRLATEDLRAEPVELPLRVVVVDAEQIQTPPRIGVVGPELVVSRLICASSTAASIAGSSIRMPRALPYRALTRRPSGKSAKF